MGSPITPKRQVKSKNLFKKDIPLYLAVVIVVISGAIVYALFPHPSEGKKVFAVAPANDCFPEKNVVRSKDYQLTHKVFLSDYKEENPKLANVKEKISQYISQTRTSNGINDISIYYRNLSNGSWFAINGGDTYNPASLLKVPFLIAMLKQAEKTPGLLDKQVYFEKHFSEGYNQNIKNFTLEEKKFYSIRELLYDMIVHSDNDALILVSKNTSDDILNKLFSDLGVNPLPSDPANSVEYSMSIIDYCKFFRVLYNSSYLKEEYSEFALELLTKSTYKEGLVKNLAGSFPVAHKFGERVLKNIQELHEVGIFYVDQKPYMLGVMSTGRDLKDLSSVLSHISEVVYKESYAVN